MFGFLKYVIFALGILAAYVLFEYFFSNRGEISTIKDSFNQAVADVDGIGETVNDEYIQPLVEQINSN